MNYRINKNEKDKKRTTLLTDPFPEHLKISGTSAVSLQKDKDELHSLITRVNDPYPVTTAQQQKKQQEEQWARNNPNASAAELFYPSMRKSSSSQNIITERAALDKTNDPRFFHTKYQPHIDILNGKTSKGPKERTMEGYPMNLRPIDLLLNPMDQELSQKQANTSTANANNNTPQKQGELSDDLDLQDQWQKDFERRSDKTPTFGEVLSKSGLAFAEGFKSSELLKTFGFEGKPPTNDQSSLESALYSTGKIVGDSLETAGMALGIGITAKAGGLAPTAGVAIGMFADSFHATNKELDRLRKEGKETGIGDTLSIFSKELTTNLGSGASKVITDKLKPVIDKLSFDEAKILFNEVAETLTNAVTSFGSGIVFKGEEPSAENFKNKLSNEFTKTIIESNKNGK